MLAGFREKKFNSGEGLCGGEKNELAPAAGKKFKTRGGGRLLLKKKGLGLGFLYIFCVSKINPPLSFEFSTYIYK